MAEYTVLVRKLTTLELLGEIPRYVGLSYARRTGPAGVLQLHVHRDQFDPSVLAALAAEELVIEIRRDGEPEHAAIVALPTYDAITQEWKIEGPCLKGWLADRLIVPASGQENDSVDDDPAESAMKGYIDRHLIDPTDTARAADGDLDGITFTAAADQARGEMVTLEKRFTLLSDALNELAVAGDLWHEVTIRTDPIGVTVLGYEYEVHEWRDATWGSGAEPVVFTVDSTGQLIYSRDRTRPTAVYVLGEGEGVTRTLEVVSVPGRRREAVLDVNSATTSDALIQEGTTYLTQQQAAAERIDAQPLTVGSQLYRDAWDLGDIVTISVPELGVELDRQIVEVAVTLDANQGETIQLALGSLPPTWERRLADALRRLQPAGLL